jgi:hypothetical protein
MPRVKLAPGIEYKIRISATLRQRIERAAKRNKNSANMEMSRRLERSFEEPASPAGDLLEGVAKVLTTAQRINGRTLNIIEQQKKQRAKREAEAAAMWKLLREMPQSVLDAINAEPEYAKAFDALVKGKADAEHVTTEAALEPAE